MSPWLDFIRMFCTLVTTAWLVSVVFIKVGKERLSPENRAFRIARWIFREVKPFFRAMAVIRFGIWVLDLTPWLWVHAIVLGVDFWNWHFYKNVDDDDDRWGRRRRKTLDKITITDGRLAVDPT